MAQAYHACVHQQHRALNSCSRSLLIIQAGSRLRRLAEARVNEGVDRAGRRSPHTTSARAGAGGSVRNHKVYTNLVQIWCGGI